jgi:hypothetical protein
MGLRDKENVCINVPKVYDWVTRQVDLPLISFTGDQLNDVNFDCDGTTPFGNLCDTLCEPFVVNCFVSNAAGQPVDPLKHGAIFCQEIVQPNGRHQVDVTLPSGETVTLEKVKVLVKGHVVVNVVDAEGTECTSEPIPFATAQTLFLCAPEGTELNCHISFFECDADLICTDQFEQLDVSITLCVEVQMEANVKLEIEAKICRPREELPISGIVCPERKFPPQCPEIFPAHNH